MKPKPYDLPALLSGAALTLYCLAVALGAGLL